MSLKAFFIFLAASAIAFAMQTSDKTQPTMTLEDTVGAPITVSRL